jgi:hypothetical protein
VIAMLMTWKEITPELYDRAREIVNWEGDPAPGGLFHVAGFDEHGLHVVDVWESVEQFNEFVQTRLNPGIAQLGDFGQPQVEIVPVHALFAPAFQPV